MNNIVRTIIFIFATLLFMLFAGWGMQHLWNWMAVGLFKGARRVDLLAGVMLVGVTYLSYEHVYARWGK